MRSVTKWLLQEHGVIQIIHGNAEDALTKSGTSYTIAEIVKFRGKIVIH